MAVSGPSAAGPTNSRMSRRVSRKAFFLGIYRAHALGFSVSVDYTLAAAKAFVDAKLAGEAKIFRMVFCSGWLAEWDQKKPLRFMEDSRKIKGQVEKGLADMADGQPEKFQSWFVRPGDIIPTNGSALRKMAASLSKGIVANKLAQAMIKVLLEGYDKRILEPADIQKVLA
ncbi:hypothetical protein RB600_000461 [Gaeumannomyces tritici]